MGLNLLLVEDDATLAASMVEELETFGHSIVVAPDGQAAIVAVADAAFDAIILDRMLPVFDGVSVLTRLRREGVIVPVIMLTALGRSVEKVEGLDAGADDYVVKPVAAEELNARLHALIRARRWNVERDADTLRAGNLTISPAKFRAWRDGKPIDLPKVEFNLLAELARNADTVMTRAMLIERVWGYDFEPTTNIVDTYIRRLRVRLMADGGEDPILTVRGVGYTLKG